MQIRTRIALKIAPRLPGFDFGAMQGILEGRIKFERSLERITGNTELSSVVSSHGRGEEFVEPAPAIEKAVYCIYCDNKCNLIAG
jgi:hypothetical protein